MHLRVQGSALLAIVLSLVLARPAEAAEAQCGPKNESCAELAYLALTYPYERLPGSYLFVDGGIYPYLSFGQHLLDDSTVRLPSGKAIAVRDLLNELGLAAEITKPQRAVIGYGSNPAPAQLSRKFAQHLIDEPAVIPVIKGQLKDFDIVWTPVFVGYGALPATIAPSPGTTVEIWVTWLDAAEFKRMDATEDAGSLYAVAELPAENYSFDGPQPDDLDFYFSCAGALTINGEALAVASVPATGRRFRGVDESGAIEAVLPTLSWTDSILELVTANLRDPAVRSAHNEIIKSLGSLASAFARHADSGCRGD